MTLLTNCFWAFPTICPLNLFQEKHPLWFENSETLIFWKMIWKKKLLLITNSFKLLFSFMALHNSSMWVLSIEKPADERRWKKDFVDIFLNPRELPTTEFSVLKFWIIFCNFRQFIIENPSFQKIRHLNRFLDVRIVFCPTILKKTFGGNISKFWAGSENQILLFHVLLTK